MESCFFLLCNIKVFPSKLSFTCLFFFLLTQSNYMHGCNLLSSSSWLSRPKEALERSLGGVLPFAALESQSLNELGFTLRAGMCPCFPPLWPLQCHTLPFLIHSRCPQISFDDILESQLRSAKVTPPYSQFAV